MIDALSEMLMQSWRGYIELFPCWPSSKSGSFERLRARGAFIVSATFDPSIGKERPATLYATGFSAFTVRTFCLPQGALVKRSRFSAKLVGGARCGLRGQALML